MAVISMKQLLEAGVHFGHQTRRWNPKMAEYIFTERNGIYIIDLQKTVKKIDEAYYFIRDIVSGGDDVLFVGTKKQAQDSIKEEAERCGQYFVNARWLGGMLTNFKTIRKRIDRLNQLREMEDSGVFNVLPKKEVIKLRGEMEKLNKYLGGISNMRRLPGVMFVVDPRKERIAILEARKLSIPIVAIVDTNCDPDEVDYVIPGNDDAIRAVKLIASKIADCVIEGRQGEQLDDTGSGEEGQYSGSGQYSGGSQYSAEREGPRYGRGDSYRDSRGDSRGDNRGGTSGYAPRQRQEEFAPRLRRGEGAASVRTVVPEQSAATAVAPAVTASRTAATSVAGAAEAPETAVAAFTADAGAATAADTDAKAILNMPTQIAPDAGVKTEAEKEASIDSSVGE